MTDLITAVSEILDRQHLDLHPDDRRMLEDALKAARGEKPELPPPATHTIVYRGHEIDPVRDFSDDGTPEADPIGAWHPCPLEEATCFEIYPADINKPKLEVEAYTLDQAKAAVDAEIDMKGSRP